MTLSQILNKLTAHKTATFDQTLINIVLVIGILIGATSIPVNFISGVNIYTHFINLVVLLVYGAMYYFARFKNKHDKVANPLIIATILFLDALWITSGGLDSPMIFYFFLSSTCFVIFTKGRNILMISVLSLINLIIMILVEANTTWVMPYLDKEIRFLDFSLSGIISLGLMIVLIRWLKLNYEIERKSAQEKKEKVELLLKELHHRVKNNLQLISSLLGLQSQRLEDGEAKNAIQLSKNRVMVMGNIHKHLYTDEDGTFINVNQYFSELSNELKSIYDPQDQVNVIHKSEDLMLNASLVLPLGLIVNEIFTNSLKYAFDGVPNPEISISCFYRERIYTLLVGDNGNGFRENELSNGSTSLGTKLIQLLTQQIDGDLKIDATSGVLYTITFPELFDNTGN